MAPALVTVTTPSIATCLIKSNKLKLSRGIIFVNLWKAEMVMVSISKLHLVSNQFYQLEMKTYDTY